MLAWMKREGGEEETKNEGIGGKEGQKEGWVGGEGRDGFRKHKGMASCDSHMYKLVSLCILTAKLRAGSYVFQSV